MYAAPRYPEIPDTHILAPVTGGMRWRRPEYAFLDYGYTPCHEEDYKDAEEEDTGNFREFEILPNPHRHRDDYISDLYAPLPDPEPVSAPEPERASLSPVFTTTPLTEARVAEIYWYQPKAHDGIATGVTWYLHRPAPGMSVAMHTGEILWTPSEGGYFEVTLCARSRYGAESRQAWTICVRKAKPKRTTTPASRYQEALRRKAKNPMAACITYTPWRQAKHLPTAPRPPAVPAGAARSPPTPLRL